ncbi:ATP-binding protein, partial [Aquibacillus koreensis]
MKSNADANMGMFVTEMEDIHFFGRDREIRLFKQWLLNTESNNKILNIYGIGGSGKTYLLHAFERMTDHENDLFLHIDCRDFIQTPLTLAENLLIQLYNKYPNIEQNKSYTLQECLFLLQHISQEKRIVIAVDAYEQMRELERWFRNTFLKNLPGNTYIVISGRNPLKGEWEESPAWRKIITRMKLSDFSYSVTKQYLSHYEIDREDLLKRIWVITKGNPLALSLAVLSIEKINKETKWINRDKSNYSPVLLQLTRAWLAETPDFSTGQAHVGSTYCFSLFVHVAAMFRVQKLH